ncbi:MAG TPA: adenylate/guanylate cyclase domain-containing protein [Solirubrobacteraceae bacterium]|nr:adenylate/guanylate cyclase domain-containing protein [Solirubrobacteraceae bacterium]
MPQRSLDWLRALAEVGVLPSDSEELRLRKAVLVLSSTLIACLACVWVITFAALGLWVPAAIPFAYQLTSALGIYTFAHTRRYLVYRRSQLWMCLVLPFMLQWSLGGFRNSSAVCLWAFTCPLGALLFVGTRQGLPWMAAFAALVAVSAAFDPALAATAPHVPTAAVVTFFVLNIAGVTATAYVLLQYFVRAREREQAKSERLLLNVLPAPIAARLKQTHEIIADAYSEVTVLFADIVDFTPLSERLHPQELVAVLDRVFGAWDQLAERYRVEKIKTIGDAYMVAAGIPAAREDHAPAIAGMALAMRCAVAAVAAQTGLPLQVRIGIDSGPVVAGVIGRAKFIYDLWGDTVNTASRMESCARPGTILVTSRTRDRLQDGYALRARGTIEVKGKGLMDPYILLRRTEPGCGSAEHPADAGHSLDAGYCEG